jgi:hypothetical protein
MPFISPTIPFRTSSTFAAGVIARQAAIVSGGLSRLDASIASYIPIGGASTLTSLGATLGAAPAGISSLFVSVNTTSFENGMVAAGFGTAQASATLSIFVQEFSSTGAFIRNVRGPLTTVFDVSAFFAGAHFRLNERNTRSASILMPAVTGRIYRAWLDSLQFVSSNGGPVAEAVSNFTYDFGSLFFAFV